MVHVTMVHGGQMFGGGQGKAAAGRPERARRRVLLRLDSGAVITNAPEPGGPAVLLSCEAAFDRGLLAPAQLARLEVLLHQASRRAGAPASPPAAAKRKPVEVRPRGPRPPAIPPCATTLGSPGPALLRPRSAS